MDIFSKKAKLVGQNGSVDTQPGLTQETTDNDLATGMRDFLTTADADELGALTNVLEQMSQKLVRLAFLVDSIATQQDGSEGKDANWADEDDQLHISKSTSTLPN